MLITIHTDKHIQGREDVAQSVEALVEDAIGDFSGWLTRVEVHLSDENGSKGGGDDKRCKIDAHPKGGQHVAVHHDAPTIKEAIEGSLDKLMTVLGKIHDKRIDSRHRPAPILAKEEETVE